jgi:hypothetical protein
VGYLPRDAKLRFPFYERRRAVPRRELLPLRGQRSGVSRKRGGPQLEAAELTGIREE